MGKRVVDDFYIHLDWIDGSLSSEHRATVEMARQQLGQSPNRFANVAKINLRTGLVSLLHYPEFESNPFPELAASWTFRDGADRPPHERRYDSTLNPPLLHRKELLVGAAHPQQAFWRRTTLVAEELGLFEEAHTIGFRLNWAKTIAAKGFALQGSDFVPIGNADAENAVETEEDKSSGVKRHLTALTRTQLSAPVQLLIRHGLLETQDKFFDYGCGRGGDIDGLIAAGYCAAGWDPYFAADRPCMSADVVNLGFVINVIEDTAERVEAIRQAFALTKRVLSVAVMLHPEPPRVSRRLVGLSAHVCGTAWAAC